MRILIVEDEKEIADGLAVILKKYKYQVDIAYDGQTGLDYILTDVYDLVLLDIMLPILNGLDILVKVREKGNNIPIILVTAKSQIPDIIEGLDLGADDYLTKPFDVEELLARIRARTRISKHPNENSISFGDLSLNKHYCKLFCGDNSIKLGNKEFQLMEYFMLNGGLILTKDMLCTKIWGFDDESDYNNVEVYVSFLRKKLKFLCSKTEIRTTKNVGYSLEKGEGL